MGKCSRNITIVLLASILTLPCWARFVGYDIARNSVVFVYGADPLGHVNTSSPLATAFLMSIPLRNVQGKETAILVTARHVVDPVWAGCPPHQNLTRIFLRLNKRNFDPASNESGFEYVPVDLTLVGPQKNVFTNVDTSVDAVVIRIPNSITEDKYEIQAISTDYFPTPDEAKQIDSGLEVMSVGLLPAFPGVFRNYPVFKFGRVSIKPSERIQVPCALNEVPIALRLWLIAANQAPGSSGSPVFTIPPDFSAARTVLMGVQSVAFDGSEVAGITPSHYIYEIIDNEKIPDWDLKEGNPTRR